jgi:hypothetical protein
MFNKAAVMAISASARNGLDYLSFALRKTMTALVSPMEG